MVGASPLLGSCFPCAKEGQRDCRNVRLPLAMVLSDHGRCLSAKSGANSISEHCEPADVNCGCELRDRKSSRDLIEMA